MGYINRFLLFLYALAVALAALGVIVLCLPVFPVPAILNETAFLLSRWETIAGAVLVFLISATILAGVMEQTGNSGVILVFIFHVRIGTQAQEFLADHSHGASVSHQTALAMRKLGVILARARSPRLPKPCADFFIEKPADEILEVDAVNHLDFSLKKLGIVHFFLVSLALVATLNVIIV